MTKSHKILVFIPPLLIGFTVLMTFFVIQHAQNQQGTQDENNVPPAATTSDDFEVTKPFPPDTPTERPLPGDSVACTMDAKMCPDGSFVGRTAPDCAFAPCPGTNGEKMTCSPQSRQAEACIEIYAPVCGEKKVECVTEPCDPIPTTYSNSCFACMDSRVGSYVDGACQAS